MESVNSIKSHPSLESAIEKFVAEGRNSSDAKSIYFIFKYLRESQVLVPTYKDPKSGQIYPLLLQNGDLCYMPIFTNDKHLPEKHKEMFPMLSIASFKNAMLVAKGEARANHFIINPGTSFLPFKTAFVDDLIKMMED